MPASSDKPCSFWATICPFWGIQQEEQMKRESECPPVLISRALFGAVDSDALTFGDSARGANKTGE